MNPFFAVCLLLAAVPSFAAAPCTFPADCAKIQDKFQEVVHAPADHAKFKQFVKLLAKSAVDRCKVGEVAALPGYRACFNTPTTDHPYSEDTVHAWFMFLKNSKFPEGHKLLESTVFQRNLDGSWADDFGTGTREE